MLAAGGTDWTHTFELYHQYTGWSPPVPTPTDNWPAYPNLLLLRDGRVFFTGIHFDGWAMPPVLIDVVAQCDDTGAGTQPAGRTRHGLERAVTTRAVTEGHGTSAAAVTGGGALRNT